MDRIRERYEERGRFGNHKFTILRPRETAEIGQVLVYNRGIFSRAEDLDLKLNLKVTEHIGILSCKWISDATRGKWTST
jgi:hypothetical protein